MWCPAALAYGRAVHFFDFASDIHRLAADLPPPIEYEPHAV